MSDRTSKFASAIAVAILPALPMTAAAEDCLKEPTGVAPEGQHWFYHNDRSTQQRCWYLRDLDDKPARAETQVPAMSAKTPAPSRKIEAAANPSMSDAFAELPSRSRAQTDAGTATTPVVQQQVTAPAAPAPVAAPVVRATDVIWPDQPSTANNANPSNPAPGDASTLVADPPVNNTQTAADPASAPTAAAPVEAPAPADKNYKNPGSLQKLLMVAGGALTLAGLIGSAVYRLASFLGRRRRHKNRWPKRTRRPQPAATRSRRPVAPREPQFAKVSAVNVGALAAVGADEFGSMGNEIPFAPPSRRTQTRQTEAPVERIEVIEEFLARFAKQAQHQ